MSNLRLFPFIVLLAMLAGVIASCSDKEPGPEPPPPNQPGWLYATNPTTTTVTLVWDDRSQDEAGFFVYDSIGGQWARLDTTASNVEELLISGLTPGTAYGFRVSAFNNYGESAFSNTAPITTQNPNIPTPPTDITATALSAEIVRVTWIGYNDPDSFVVQRRIPAESWETLRTLANTFTQFNDSTAAAQTTYYYRVGAEKSELVAWSEDSADVTTPAVGSPVPPDSIHATVNLSVGVVLTWADRSTDETGFQIGRSLSGEQMVIIATVPENTTTYTDSLDTPGRYYYRLRSINEHGESAWTFPILGDFRLCSFGVIPTCVGNYWEYVVDSSGVQYTVRRRVAEMEFVNGDDYYLFVQNPILGGLVDSLYYLRNVADEGAFYVDHPLPTQPIPGLLFKYPNALPGNYYFVEGDCVLVLTSSQGIRYTLPDTVYTGVISFQRFFDSSHSIQYWIRPNDVGIIREIEYYSINPPHIVDRILDRYYIQPE